MSESDEVDNETATRTFLMEAKVSQAVLESIENGAEQLGISKDEFLKDALAVFIYIIQQAKAEYALQFVKPEDLENSNARI